MLILFNLNFLKHGIGDTIKKTLFTNFLKVIHREMIPYTALETPTYGIGDTNIRHWRHQHGIGDTKHTALETPTYGIGDTKKFSKLPVSCFVSAR